MGHNTICSCCGGGNLLITDKVNQSFGVNYAKCKDCFHVQLEAFPNDDALKDFYNQYSNHRTLSSHLITLYTRRAEAQFAYIMEFIESEIKNGGATIYDIGCGYGFLLSMFANMKNQLVGIEVDEKCKKYIKDKTNICVLTGIDKMLLHIEEGNQCSLVCMSHFLEHERDVHHLLHELYCHECKYIFIEVPSESSFLHEKIDEAHIHYFTKESLSALIHRAGYEICDLNCYGYTVVSPFNVFGRFTRKALSHIDPIYYSFSRKNTHGAYLRAFAKIKKGDTNDSAARP